MRTFIRDALDGFRPDRHLDEAHDWHPCLAFNAIAAFRVWDRMRLTRERPDDPARR